MTFVCMASYRLLVLIVLLAHGYWNLVLSDTASCNVPTCTCYFGNNETVDIEPNTSGNEALAGVVGGLSSLVLAGGGFGLYSLLRKRCETPEDGLFDRRRGSDSSNQSLYNNKKYPGRLDTPPRGTNVYRSGIKDDINHRVGSRGRNSGYENDIVSDWT